MKIDDFSKGTALISHVSHSFRDKIVSILVIMKVTGTAQPTSSCLMTNEYRNAFRFL